MAGGCEGIVNSGTLGYLRDTGSDLANRTATYLFGENYTTPLSAEQWLSDHPKTVKTSLFSGAVAYAYADNYFEGIALKVGPWVPGFIKTNVGWLYDAVQTNVVPNFLKNFVKDFSTLDSSKKVIESVSDFSKLVIAEKQAIKHALPVSVKNFLARSKSISKLKLEDATTPGINPRKLAFLVMLIPTLGTAAVEIGYNSCASEEGYCNQIYHSASTSVPVTLAGAAGGVAASKKLAGSVLLQWADVLGRWTVKKGQPGAKLLRTGRGQLATKIATYVIPIFATITSMAAMYGSILMGRRFF